MQCNRIYFFLRIYDPFVVGPTIYVGIPILFIRALIHAKYSKTMSEHIIFAPYYSKDHEKARKSTLRSKFGEEKKTIEEFHFPSSFIGELSLGFPKRYHMSRLASRS